MTDAQRIILAKLEGKVTGHVAETSPFKIEWRQRRVKNGLTLWIADVSGLYLANITDAAKVSVVPGGGSYAVMHIDRLVNEFDALVTSELVADLKPDLINPRRAILAEAALARLLRKYSRR